VAISVPLDHHPAVCTYYQDDHKAKLAELVEMIKGTKAASSVTIARSYPTLTSTCDS
jgi:hypothetical protein